MDRIYFTETENWKHCSKIIFKCVNSAVRLIFNEKVVEKWSLWVREQCTGALFTNSSRNRAWSSWNVCQKKKVKRKRGCRISVSKPTLNIFSWTMSFHSMVIKQSSKVLPFCLMLNKWNQLHRLPHVCIYLIISLAIA